MHEVYTLLLQIKPTVISIIDDVIALQIIGLGLIIRKVEHTSRKGGPYAEIFLPGRT